ncbi:MAG: hypothetical protein ACE5GL_12265 [Calditrichia bacterium]
MTSAKNLFRRRRLTLKSIVAGLFLLPLHAFILMVKTYLHYLKIHEKPLEIPSDVPEGVSFRNKIFWYETSMS